MTEFNKEAHEYLKSITKKSESHGSFGIQDSGSESHRRGQFIFGSTVIFDCIHHERL